MIKLNFISLVRPNVTGESRGHGAESLPVAATWQDIVIKTYYYQEETK